MIAAILLMADAPAVVALPKPLYYGPTQNLLAKDPPDVVHNRRGGGTHYKAIIRPDGKPDACVVLASTLTEGDTKHVCAVIKADFRYDRIRGPSGEPLHYLMEARTRWIVEGGDNTAYPPVPEIKNQLLVMTPLPKYAEAGLPAEVNVVVDTQGGLVACSPKFDAQVPALSRSACKAFGELWKPMPEKNAAGEPISYIRQLTVTFRKPEDSQVTATK